MQITRLNNSASTPSYRLQAETKSDYEVLSQCSADQLADLARSFNYGGYVIQRTKEAVLLNVYID